jgi:hypothetical protein
MYSEIFFRLSRLREMIGYLEKTIPTVLLSEASKMYLRDIKEIIGLIAEDVKELKKRELERKDNE